MTIYTVRNIEDQEVFIEIGKKLATGGEGELFETSNPTLVAKIHFAALSDMQAEKVGTFCSLNGTLPSFINAPQYLIYDENDALVGYILPRLPDGFYPLSALVSRDFRDKNGLTAIDVIDLLLDFSRKSDIIHRRGAIIIGDNNIDNAVVVPGQGIVFIDTISWQIVNSLCLALHPEYTAPWLWKYLDGAVMREPECNAESDTWALGVIIMRTMLYIHPYMGNHPLVKGGLKDRVQQRASIFDPGVKTPRFVLPAETLGQDLANALKDMFTQHIRYSSLTAQLEETRKAMMLCNSCNNGHPVYLPSCPSCGTTNTKFISRSKLLKSDLEKTEVFTGQNVSLESLTPFGIAIVDNCSALEVTPQTFEVICEPVEKGTSVNAASDSFVLTQAGKSLMYDEEGEVYEIDPGYKPFDNQYVRLRGTDLVDLDDKLIAKNVVCWESRDKLVFVAKGGIIYILDSPAQQKPDMLTVSVANSHDTHIEITPLDVTVSLAMPDGCNVFINKKWKHFNKIVGTGVMGLSGKEFLFANDGKVYEIMGLDLIEREVPPFQRLGEFLLIENTLYTF